MGITDDKHVCNLCGDHKTSCALCRGNPAQRVVSVPPPPLPPRPGRAALSESSP